ncbi:MAG: DUF1538 domain-containing protein [Clostridiaceae bacterium]|nr:DUF1538 domain-containing protein [Clostridiaceae bacterium]
MELKETVKEVVYSVVPIVIIVAVVQFALKLPAETIVNFFGGAVFVFIGLVLFLTGVKVGFLPVGESIGNAIVSKGKMWIVLLSGFIIGFVVNVAEPDLQVLAGQIDQVSGGTISKTLIIVVVSLGIGVFLALGLLRNFLKIPMLYLLLGGYAIVFVLSMITPKHFFGVGFDSGFVTTGPMTVPFIISLGVGVSSVMGKHKSDNDSFGLVALSTIGPIIAVLLLGVFFG